ALTCDGPIWPGICERELLKTIFSTGSWLYVVSSLLANATDIDVSCGLSTSPLFVTVPLSQSFTAVVTSTRMCWYLPPGYGTTMGLTLSIDPDGVLAPGVV